LTDLLSPGAARANADEVRLVQPEARPRAVLAAASGKAIIVGEHAVVYGARAVAMPLQSLQMSVRLVPTARRDKSGKPLMRLRLGGRSVTAHLAGVLDDAFDVLGIEPFPLDLEGNSTVLIGAGLGSSASLCVVVIKALAAATGRELAAGELAAAANRLEARFHGNPSGLDTAVVALGEVIEFAKGTKPARVAVAPPRPGATWRFALLDSGARSSTLAMVQAAAPYFRGQAGAQRLAAFDAAAGAVAAGLAAGRQEQVGAAMRDASAWLAEAGLVNRELAELIALATAAGAVATKPTGAGGGGCVLALLDHEQAEVQLAMLAKKLGPTRVYGVELP
jgi:mevalonate kinase